MAKGTKLGNTVLAKSYPQMAEYADQVLGLMQKLKPIPLSDSDLYFGGSTAVFDFSFIAVNGFTSIYGSKCQLRQK